MLANLLYSIISFVKAGTPEVLQTNLKAISETESVFASKISDTCKLLFAKILLVQATKLK